MFNSRRIRTTTVTTGLIGLGFFLTACDDGASIDDTAKSNGYTQLGTPHTTDRYHFHLESIAAMVGECPVVLSSLNLGDENDTGNRRYSVKFNGRLGAKISDTVLTPNDGAGELPPAEEIANVLNYGKIAKERGVTNPNKVPGSRLGVCDPYKGLQASNK